MEYQIADLTLQLPDQLIPPRFAEALNPFALTRPKGRTSNKPPEASDPGVAHLRQQTDLILLPAGQIRREDGWHELLRFEFTDAEADCRFGRDAEGWLLEMTPRINGSATVRFRYATASGEALCDYTPEYHPGLFRFGVWILFNLSALQHAAVAIHASALRFRGHAVLFLGESGTGKSTHTRLWRQYIPGAALLNDDSPVIRCHESAICAWGSPWSGKLPCYRNEALPVAAFVRLVQGAENRIRELAPIDAFGALFPSLPPAFVRDAELRDRLVALLTRIIPRIPVYRLECRPDADAARLACRTLFGEVPHSPEPLPAESADRNDIRNPRQSNHRNLHRNPAPDDGLAESRPRPGNGQTEHSAPPQNPRPTPRR